MVKISNRRFNHDHAGITALRPPLHPPPSPLAIPEGFRVNARRQLLGTGSKASVFFLSNRSRRWIKGRTAVSLTPCGEKSHAPQRRRRNGAKDSGSPSSIARRFWDLVDHDSHGETT